MTCKAHLLRQKNIVSSFIKRIEKTDVGDCWIWSGSRFKTQYGRLSVSRSNSGVNKRITLRAHVFSKAFHEGHWPDNLLCCHRCDNPGCVNPNHLFWGTAKDNHFDMDKKGRGRFRGSRHGRAKLNERQAAEIFAAYHSQQAESVSAIADKFCVSIAIVRSIGRLESWVHVNQGKARTRRLTKNRPSTSYATGERHGNSKFTNALVLKVWQLHYAERKTRRQIAQEVNVSVDWLGKIFRRELWVGVTKNLGVV